MARKIPADVPLVRDLLEKVVGKYSEGTNREVSGTLRDLLDDATRKSFRSKGRKPSRLGSQDMLFRIGLQSWKRSDPKLHLWMVLRAHGPDVFAYVYRGLQELHTHNRSITESVDLTYLIPLMLENRGKKLTLTRYLNLKSRIKGQLGDDASIHHPEFLHKVADDRADVERLASTKTFLDAHGIASLGTEPLLMRQVRTGSLVDPARLQQSVDLLVVFRATMTDGTFRYLRKSRLQSKMTNVRDLVSQVTEGGEVELGQLKKDQLREDSGAWEFSKIRLEKEMFIPDDRPYKVLSVGLRDFTEAERKSLADEGILVHHFEHEHTGAEYELWIDLLFRICGITTE